MTRYVVGWMRPDDLPDDETYDDGPPTSSTDVIDEGGPVFTGLYDDKGQPIYRIDRVPMGFCR